MDALNNSTDIENDDLYNSSRIKSTRLTSSALLGDNVENAN